MLHCQSWSFHPSSGGAKALFVRIRNEPAIVINRVVFHRIWTAIGKPFKAMAHGRHRTRLKTTSSRFSNKEKITARNTCSIIL